MSTLESGDTGSGFSGLWKPSAREQKTYSYLFSLVDIDHKGVIQGQSAVPFFQKSGLTDAELGRIWQLADTKSKGHLTQQEFEVAMKLISLAQAGKAVSLASLKDEASLPEMKGIDLSLAVDVDDARSHSRRDSSTSSVGWPSAPSGTNGGFGEITIPASEREQYKRLFDSSHPVDGAIDGMTAKAFLMKSKLNVEQLGKIWTLADPQAEGKLRLPGFVVAMYYVRRIMENRNLVLPSACSPSLWRSAGGEAPPPSLPRASSAHFSEGYGRNSSTPDLSAVQWDVTAEEKERYDQFFANLDKHRRGYLSGDTPVNFFLKSKLPEGALAKVWDLADIKHTGSLNREQFAVAMHLINARLAGGKIPDTLPATLVPPSMRRASVISPSLRSLSPTLRPVSASERTQQLDPLRRSTTLSHGRGPAPAAMARSSTGRSPAPRSPTPRSPTIDESEISSLQGQLGQLEDISRGLQTQRTTIAGQIAVSSARKQELEVKIAALQSSHDAETKINHELEEKLRAEEGRVSALQAQVDEANKKLAIVGAQRSQLEQDVQRIQLQQQELHQKLRQAQDEAQRLTAEISSLGREKKHLEQVLSVAQSQVKQQEDSSRALSEQAESAKGEVAELSRRVAALPTPSASGAVTSSQARSVAEPQAEPSFDDIFGSGDSLADSPGPTAFGDMFKSPPPPEATEESHNEPSPTTNGGDAFAQFISSAGSASAAPAASPGVSAPPTADMAPSAIFASMPSISMAAGSSAAFSSSEAFDSFGVHSVDPFEEFLQSTVASNPAAAKSAVSNASLASLGAPIPAERPADTLPRSNGLLSKQETDAAAASDFDAIFGSAEASGAQDQLQLFSITSPAAVAATSAAAMPRASSDPRSVASTPAPASSMFSSAADAPANKGAEGSGSKTDPSSPFVAPAASAAAGGSGAGSASAFDADFNTAFGMMPGSGDRAIAQDIETFESKFPDIDTLNISDTIADSKKSISESISKGPPTASDLTFDSVFGPSDDAAESAAGDKAARSSLAAPAAPAAESTAAAAGTDAANGFASQSVDKKQSKDSADGFVPPPVVKRTNVSARPISRVLSIFRPSSSSRSSSAAGAPPLPKRSATDRRQGGSASRDKDRDREFEAKWAKGDWPEWVKKGEYLYERRTLVEMGYSKDRVVEALEVNDFNLMQATEYLLSS